jgi:hypothetical protein
MAFKVEVQTDDTGQWYANELTFATEEEATKYGMDLASRWTLVRSVRVIVAPD